MSPSKGYGGIKTPKTVPELTDALNALFSPITGDCVVVPVTYKWGVEISDADETPTEEWERKLVRNAWFTATAQHQNGARQLFIRSNPAIIVERDYLKQDYRISVSFRAAFI